MILSFLYWEILFKITFQPPFLLLTSCLFDKVVYFSRFLFIYNTLKLCNALNLFVTLILHQLLPVKKIVRLVEEKYDIQPLDYGQSSTPSPFPVLPSKPLIPLITKNLFVILVAINEWTSSCRFSTFWTNIFSFILKWTSWLRLWHPVLNSLATF